MAMRTDKIHHFAFRKRDVAHIVIASVYRTQVDISFLVCHPDSEVDTGLIVHCLIPVHQRISAYRAFKVKRNKVVHTL